MDSRGTADRIAERILPRAPRPGSCTPARYSSTLAGAGTPPRRTLEPRPRAPFAAPPRLPAFVFFMRTMLKQFLFQPQPRRPMQGKSAAASLASLGSRSSSNDDGRVKSFFLLFFAFSEHA